MDTIIEQLGKTVNNEVTENEDVRYKDLFYNPRYSRAFYVGSSCAIL